MTRVLQIAFISTAIMSGVYAAPDIQLDGTHVQTLSVPTSNVDDAAGPKALMKKGAPFTKSIKILNIQLSDHAKQMIEDGMEHSSTSEESQPIQSNHLSKVQLGMGNVPVLDQGQHGSCVTFAVTAAVDAVLQKGDYVSQLCQLQLGRYLEENALSFSPGGWEGSWGRIVLGQINQFGVVSKAQESSQGCGGMMAYPLNDDTIPSSTLSLDQFHRMSEDANTLIEWTTLLDIDDAFRDDLNRSEVFNRVKSSLASGDRVAFGTVLFNLESGIAGAVGSNHVKNDTWLLTAEMEQDFDQVGVLGLHEMVITGYDDQATAKDNKGRIHHGLFTIRNSWGNRVADQGNFYMTYDYFMHFVIEAHRVGKPAG